MALSWTEAEARRFRELMAIIDQPDFVPATWADFSKPWPDGKYRLPYPTYAPEVDEIWALLAKSGVMRHPYELLPEDPPDAKAGLETHLILKTVEDIEGATIDQIGRYLMLCRRAERFADGHIDDEFRSGRLVAALRRVAELKGVLD